MGLYDELLEIVRRFPPVSRYELHCHPTVYYAIQRSDIASYSYSTDPVTALYGIDIVVRPEVGKDTWKLYANGELVDYGRIEPEGDSLQIA